MREKNNQPRKHPSNPEEHSRSANNADVYQGRQHLPGPILIYTSTESQRSTPSPDSAISLCNTSLPIFVERGQNATSEAGTPQALSECSSTYDYASERTFSREGSVSDSGISTIPEDFRPFCTKEWHQDLMHPKLLEHLQEQHQVVEQRSGSKRKSYLGRKMAELPPEPEYPANKGRLRAVYEDPLKAAERVKNNIASHNSRHKKKMKQTVTNINLGFNQNENQQLLDMEEWIVKMASKEETNLLASDVSAERLYELRSICGFPQNWSERRYIAD